MHGLGGGATLCFSVVLYKYLCHAPPPSGLVIHPVLPVVALFPVSRLMVDKEGHCRQNPKLHERLAACRLEVLDSRTDADRDL